MMSALQRPLSLRAHPLATVNAALNALATVLLVTGLRADQAEARDRPSQRHARGLRRVGRVPRLLSCVPHRGDGGQKHAVLGHRARAASYYAILISHIILAATVPFLAGWNIWLGLTDQRLRHRRLARWTFPIWLYVSITGVVIYWMLYHLYPPAPSLDL